MLSAMQIRQKAYYERNKESITIKRNARIEKEKARDIEAFRTKQRGYFMKSKYGITTEQYQDMLTAQDYKCAICESESAKTALHDTMVVDHNHETGEVRGLLCDQCNRGIGMLQDDPEVLKSAITYLEIHNGSNSDKPE